MLSPLDRFRSKFTQGAPDECWEWSGAVDGAGYGRLAMGKTGKGAHRIAWELENLRPVPKGMLVCHTCDNRRCVNPRHLFIGTPKDNTDDMRAKGRAIASARPGRVSFTEEDRAAIRLRSANGERQKDIAKSYGASRLTINRICSGWRDKRQS